MHYSYSLGNGSFGILPNMFWKTSWLLYIDHFQLLEQVRPLFSCIPGYINPALNTEDDMKEIRVDKTDNNNVQATSQFMATPLAGWFQKIYLIWKFYWKYWMLQKAIMTHLSLLEKMLYKTKITHLIKRQKNKTLKY